jgi:hypothetical protein
MMCVLSGLATSTNGDYYKVDLIKAHGESPLFAGPNFTHHTPNFLRCQVLPKKA